MISPSNMSDDELKVLGAIAASVAAIVVSLISAVLGFLSTRANQRDVERLKAQLLDEKGESDAKRSYTYEAMKRLYAQYEPIRFHLIESVETALKTINDLAAIAKVKTSDSEGAYPQGKYLRAACVYHLLAPAANFKIMQSRLTLIDLAASRASFLQYLLAKEACHILTCDRETANHFSLPYTPYVQGWRELRQENPGRYRRQGFAFGRFDNAVSAIIKQSEDGIQKIKCFGEFENEANIIERTDYSSPLGAALDLFDEFSPSARPVLWRSLLIQVSLYKLLVYAARSSAESLDDIVSQLPSIGLHLQELGCSEELSKATVEFVRSGPLNSIRMSHSNA